jgi:hypothetical protein
MDRPGNRAVLSCPPTLRLLKEIKDGSPHTYASRNLEKVSKRVKKMKKWKTGILLVCLAVLVFNAIYYWSYSDIRLTRWYNIVQLLKTDVVYRWIFGFSILAIWGLHINYF